MTGQGQATVIDVFYGKVVVEPFVDGIGAIEVWKTNKSQHVYTTLTQDEAETIARALVPDMFARLAALEVAAEVVGGLLAEPAAAREEEANG